MSNVPLCFLWLMILYRFWLCCCIADNIAKRQGQLVSVCCEPPFHGVLKINRCFTELWSNMDNQKTYEEHIHGLTVIHNIFMFVLNGYMFGGGGVGGGVAAFFVYVVVPKRHTFQRPFKVNWRST